MYTMKQMKYFFILLLAFMTTAAGAQVISCDSARTLGPGATVTISGIVTNGAELGTIRYLQDATGGIAVYSYSMSSNVERGDSLVATGSLKEWNNLLELDPVTSYNVVSSNHPLPAPKNINLNQLGESLEAEIVRVDGINFVSTGVFAGNTNYNITDGAVTGEIRINTSSSLVGEPIPVGTLSLIGICGQYSYYPNDTTGGYQILLRDSNDIVSASAISLTSPLEISNITTSGFDLGWTTDINGSTNIEYGFTNALEQGSLSGSGNTTTHSISLTGLSASQLVYARAVSVSGNDTAFSAVGTFITQSASTGDMKVYFTNTVDNTVSTGVNAIQCDNSLDDTLIAYINRAQYSIDLAIYNFTTTNISSISAAMNNAYSNGVDVRVIFDGSGTSNTGVQALNAAIPTLASPAASPHKIMHNKFVVIDGKSSDPNDPIVWTGSMNWTETGINSYSNNVIIIQDKSLAQAYILEFEEMWGSSTMTPNQTNSRFGPYKLDNTPHEFVINGKRVECYFSPSDGVNGKIISTLETADEELFVNTMLITRSDIAYAISDVAATGVNVKIIVDNKSSCMPNGSTTVVNAISSAISSEFKEYGESGILHHKLMMVDPGYPNDDPLVWTGSHNWSSSADGENDENTVVVHDATIANIYYQEFVERFSLGTVIDGIGEAVDIIRELDVYPNPVQDKLHIEFYSDHTLQAEMLIFDMNASLVFSISECIHTGLNTLSVDLPTLEKGTYFLKLGNKQTAYLARFIVF